MTVQTAKIRRKIVYIIYERNVWICKRYWISRTPKIQREIVYIIYVRNGWIYRKIECPVPQKFNGEFCTLIVRNVGICRKIEYPELRNFNGKLCTLFMYGQSKFAEKLKVQNSGNSIWNYVQYMYGMFGFTEKLNIQNCVDSTENCVHYICTTCLDLQKNWLSRTA